MLKTVNAPNSTTVGNEPQCKCDVPVGRVVRFPLPHIGYRLLETKYPLVSALLLAAGFSANFFMFVIRGSLLNLLVAIIVGAVAANGVRTSTKIRNHERIAAHLIAKRNVPTKTRQWAATHPCHVMRLGLASSPHTPTEMLNSFIFDDNQHVVYAAAQNPNLSERARTIAHLNLTQPKPLNIQFKYVPKRAHADCSGCGQFKRIKFGGTWFNVLCTDCENKPGAKLPSTTSCDKHKKHKPNCRSCAAELAMERLGWL